MMKMVAVLLHWCAVSSMPPCAFHGLMVQSMSDWGGVASFRPGL
jgi:hypothetical protein